MFHKQNIGNESTYQYSISSKISHLPGGSKLSKSHKHLDQPFYNIYGESFVEMLLVYSIRIRTLPLSLQLEDSLVRFVACSIEFLG